MKFPGFRIRWLSTYERRPKWHSFGMEAGASKNGGEAANFCECICTSEQMARILSYLGGHTFNMATAMG